MLKIFLRMAIDKKQMGPTETWAVAARLMLQNSRLLTVLLELRFVKTNPYILDSVFNTLDIADNWFSVIKENHFELPDNFNYSFFEEAIRRLIETDHFQIITRTLILIYNCIDLFSGIRRSKFVWEFLLKNYFFKLFLHWHSDTRTCFHRILVYKVTNIIYMMRLIC